MRSKSRHGVHRSSSLGKSAEVAFFSSAVKESETGIQRSKMLDETDEFLQALGPQRNVAERLLDLLKLCRVQSDGHGQSSLGERWKRIPFTAAALGESAVHNSLTSCRM